MAYHCPHCQKFSYAPQGFEQLEGFAMICAHCQKAFCPKAIGDRAPNKSKGDIFPIICPHCGDRMRLHDKEYDLLKNHKLTCLTCANHFLLPDKKAPIAVESAGRSLLKFGILYVLILASLALIFTPQGADLITYFGQMSDAPRQHLRSFHEIWHDFRIFLISFFR